MEELKELIGFLKAKGLEDYKINVDLLVGIIEYFQLRKDSTELLTEKEKLSIEYSTLSRVCEYYPKKSCHYAYLEINKRMEEILQILKSLN